MLLTAPPRLGAVCQRIYFSTPCPATMIWTHNYETNVWQLLSLLSEGWFDPGLEGWVDFHRRKGRRRALLAWAKVRKLQRARWVAWGW